MKKVRSAKGVLVDFDLMKIKETLEAEPAPTDVRARQDHIDARLRRRMRTMKPTALPTTPPKRPIEVAPTSPAVNDTDVEMIDENDVETIEKPQPKPTQQKARRTTKKSTKTSDSE